MKTITLLSAVLAGCMQLADAAPLTESTVTEIIKEVNLLPAGASAAVLGTTLMVAATANGGLKVIVLEGQGRVTLPNGKRVNLNAGQMVLVLPGGGGFSDVLDINLATLVSGSLLVKGFSRELPSVAKIDTAIKKQ